MDKTIIIATVFIVLCICISATAGYFIFSKKPETQKLEAQKEEDPGKIGGDCLAKNLCNDEGAECKYGKCYEKCIGRGTWPCNNAGDIPRIHTYYCDYADCKDGPEEEEVRGPSMVQQEIARIQKEDEKKKLQREQKKKENEARKKLAAEAAQKLAAEQKRLCTCYSGAVLTDTSRWGCLQSDRDEPQAGNMQKWCYVVGGEQCKEAAKSTHKDRAGMAWKWCN